MNQKLSKAIFIAFILTTVASLNSFAQDESRLMRFPTINGSKVVFSYAGDLYAVDTSGGLARKLTNFAGYEMFAKFSPDGKQLAFTGEYDGNREVYVMPSQGGVPKRLTYTATINRDDLSDRMGPNNIVMAWKDNETVIFRSRKITFNDFTGELYSISTKGGLEAQLPFPRGGFCSYSPDKTKLAYNRVFREFRTWKYYTGGMADDVWIYDFNTKVTENITSNNAQDIFPMWYNNKIYFLSDRDRIMNMFEYDITTKQTRKVTNFNVYDIKFPSIGDKYIIFENGGYLYTYDIPSGLLRKLTIKIADDFVNSRTVLIDATKYIENTDISPDGKRLLFCARGEVFTVPAEKGFVRNLTKTGNAHDRNAVWSPNGKYVAYISDISGETEIYMVAQDGTSAPVQLTKNGDTYKYALRWSPDSKKILWADKKLRLQYVDVETKNITLVDKAESWEFNSYTWSPDSKWIAYTRPELITKSNIYLYELASKNKYLVTDGWFDSGAPSFSDDGRYLFFTSQRDFNPIYSQTEWNHAYVDMSRIYFVTLSKATPSPFETKNDETKIASEKPPVQNEAEKDKKPAQDTAKDKSKVVKIDIDGIQGRILSLPVKPGSYYGIHAVGDKVYYVKGGYKEKGSMCMYDLKDLKETELGEYHSYLFTKDNKKVLISSGDKYYVIDAPKGKITLEKSVDISEMKLQVNKNEEWNQIYDEAWRQMRDFFFDSNMHGVNWKAMHEKYKPLVNYVNHRDDLNYIIGELIGELNIGHAYVGGGDRPKVDRVKMGLLGAQLVRDDKTGYYQIVKILKGENWDKSMKSPLTELGLNVKPGDYIIAVNGEPTNKMQNIYASLIGKNDVEVELSINSKPDAAGSRKVLVVPIADESALNYYNWVQENIRKVTEATNGKVGYVHIPDMGVAGLNEFVKYFYPQMNKKALIIDDRGNGGGNVSPMIIERLRRELSRATYVRNTVKNKVPGQMLLGPKVCLINEYSASDGDLFPYQFRKHNLGKLIGKRTWGGVTGIRGSLPFVDGSFLNRPEFSTYDENGWMIEGHGVDPDIYIDNDPAKEYAGIDEQLNKAIEVILEELKKNPQEIPDVPPFPNKSK
jgi:tricorn protease